MKCFTLLCCAVLSLVSVLSAQDADTLKKKRTEVTAFLKTAKTEREFRIALLELSRFAERAFEINEYEQAGLFYRDAEKVARTMLKDAGLATSLVESAKRTSDVGRQFEKARRAYDLVLEKKATPEDQLVVGKFICFVKGVWDIGLKSLAEGNDEKLKALADRDLYANETKDQRVGLGDSWAELSKKEPAARDRALHWYAQAWPLTGGIEREGLRSKLRAFLFRPGPNPSKPPSYPVSGNAKGRILIDERTSFSGARSLVLLPGDPKTTNGGFIPAFRSPLVPGKYVLSFMVLTDGMPGNVPLFTAKIKNAAQQETRKDLSPTSDQPWWTRVETTLEIPQGGSINLYASMWHERGTIWLDDLSVRNSDGVEFVDNGDFEK
jgi:hypothetical protein